MSRSLRIYYAAGPGDVVGTLRHYAAGRDDPSQTAVAYSKLFYEACDARQVEGLAVSSALERDSFQNGRLAAINWPKPKAGKTLGAIEYQTVQAWSGLRTLARALAWRADGIVLADGTTEWLYGPLFTLAGLPTAAALHNTFWPKGGSPQGFSGRRIALARPFFRRWAACLFSASHEIERQVQAITGGCSAPIIPFLPLYRREVFSDIPPPSFSTFPFQVLYAGRVEPEKGVFELLEAACQLQATHPGKFSFSILGTGSALNVLREAARPLGGAFQCVGHVKQDAMCQYLKNCHAVAVPTTDAFNEGFNQSVVEGVLAARPVIATAVCPAVEHVPKAVVKLAPTSTSELPALLSKALVRLAECPDEYASLVTAATEYQGQFYDPTSSFAAALEQFFELLTAEAPAKTWRRSR